MAPSARQVRGSNDYLYYAILDGSGAAGLANDKAEVNAAATGAQVPGIINEVTSALESFVVTFLDADPTSTTKSTVASASATTHSTTAKTSAASTTKASTTSTTSSKASTTSTSTKSSSSSSSSSSTSPTSTAKSSTSSLATQTVPSARVSTATFTQLGASNTASASLTSLSSSTNAADSTTGSAASSVALSKPAMIGIIVGAVVVFTFIVLFILRKVCLVRRQRELLAWDEGLAPYGTSRGAAPIEKVEAEVGRRMNANIVPLPGAAGAMGGAAPSSMPIAPTIAAPPPVASKPLPPINAPVPPAQYRPVPAPINTAMDGAYPTMSAGTKRMSSVRVYPNAIPAAPPSASIYAVTPPPPSLSPAQSLIRTVVTTYTPQMQDELPLTVGERLRVIEVFEDGWAMVERAGMSRGGMPERGVVPVECLGMNGPR